MFFSEHLIPSTWSLRYRASSKFHSGRNSASTIKLTAFFFCVLMCHWRLLYSFGWISIIILLPHFCAKLVQPLWEQTMAVSEENVIRHPFNGWAAVMVPCVGPVFEELYAFLCVCVCFFRDKTMLQLLKVVIHHGESNNSPGGRLLPLLRERLKDLAIPRWLTARYQLQVCNPQPMYSTIQTTRTFSGQLFLVNYLLHAFSGVLCALLHKTRGREVSAVNTIRRWKHVVTTTYDAFSHMNSRLHLEIHTQT